MSGTREGGLKTKAKNLANDPEFYKKIGKKGGKVGTTGGFAAYTPCDCKLYKKIGDHHKAQCAGYRGGVKSRRGKAKTIVQVEHVSSSDDVTVTRKKLFGNIFRRSA